MRCRSFGKLARLGGEQRFEDAARLRDRIAALEEICRGLAEVERLRKLEICLVVPAIEDGGRRGVFVAKCGHPRPAAARRPRPEWQAGLADVARAKPTAAPEATDELLLIGLFLRRPPP